MFITSAYAQGVNAAANATGSATDGLLIQLLPIALILLVFYMFVFRPMDMQKKAQATLLSSVKKGDEIVTTAGLIGKISKIDDSEVVLELADGIRIRILRSTIASLYGASAPEKPKSP